MLVGFFSRIKRSGDGLDTVARCAAESDRWMQEVNVARVSEACRVVA